MEWIKNIIDTLRGKPSAPPPVAAPQPVAPAPVAPPTDRRMTAGGAKAEIELNPEIFGPRPDGTVAPAVPPAQGGGYRTGSDVQLISPEQYAQNLQVFLKRGLSPKDAERMLNESMALKGIRVREQYGASGGTPTQMPQNPTVGGSK